MQFHSDLLGNVIIVRSRVDNIVKTLLIEKADNFKIFQEKFDKLSGEKYSQKKVQNLVNDLNDYTLNNDFIFINANFEEIINE